MKLMLVTVAFVLSFLPTVQASELHLSEENKYETLNSYFSLGQLPTESEMNGWWSGRCYAKSAPNAPAGLLLIGASTYQTPMGQDGPLFPPQPVFLMALVGSFENPATRFDNITSSDRILVEQFVQSSEFRGLRATPISGSMVSHNDTGNLSFVVRKYQNYFLAQAVAIRDSDNTKAGEIYSSCYFFNKVN